MVTIDVTNQAPIAADLDPLFVLHGRTISGIDLLGAASDPDADSLSVQIVSYPTQGYLYQDWYTGKWNYSAPSSYAGPIAFSYRVYDGQAYSNTANVSIEVTNQAPNANADWELSPASGTSINILANDTDPDGDPLAITNYTQPNYGSLLLQGSGSEAFFIYTPYAGTSASMDTFEYTVSDGHGGSSTATVMVSFRTLLKFDTVTHETVYGTQNGAISIERTGGDLSNLLYVPLHFASLGNEAVPSIDFDLLDGLQVVTYGVTFLPGETKKTLWVVAHTNPEGIFPQLSAYATAAPSELWGVDPETFADITITPAPSAVGRIIGFAESTQSEKNLDQATDAKFFVEDKNDQVSSIVVAYETKVIEYVGSSIYSEISDSGSILLSSAGGEVSVPISARSSSSVTKIVCTFSIQASTTGAYVVGSPNAESVLIATQPPPLMPAPVSVAIIYDPNQSAMEKYANNYSTRVAMDTNTVLPPGHVRNNAGVEVINPAWIDRALDSADASISSMETALNGRKTRELRFYVHGGPGTFFLGAAQAADIQFTVDAAGSAAQRNRYRALMTRLGNMVTDGGQIRLYSCHTACVTRDAAGGISVDGIAFLRRLRDETGRLTLGVDEAVVYPLYPFLGTPKAQDPVLDSFGIHGFGHRVMNRFR